jgi:hypothetical protein
MGARIEAGVNRERQFSRQALNESQKSAVREELEKILESPAFRGSRRASELLTYAVEHRLNGREDLLKERTIGIEIFHRSPGYATGEDSVVRVNATELRRRLGQYYSRGKGDEVRIDLPVGSYVPEFQWGQRDHLPANTSRIRTWRVPWVIGVLASVVILIYALRIHVQNAPRNAQPSSLVQQFWEPILRSSQPVMLCVGTSVVYGISQGVYDKYNSAHHLRQPLNLEAILLPPEQILHGSDVFPLRDQFIGVGTAKALALRGSSTGLVSQPKSG